MIGEIVHNCSKVQRISGFSDCALCKDLEEIFCFSLSLSLDLVIWRSRHNGCGPFAFSKPRPVFQRRRRTRIPMRDLDYYVRYCWDSIIQLKTITWSTLAFHYSINWIASSGKFQVCLDFYPALNSFPERIARSTIDVSCDAPAVCQSMIMVWFTW